MPNRDIGKINIWTNNNINATRAILGNLSYSGAIFVTTNGDIYIDNGASNGRVEKWTSCTNTWTPVMYVNTSCFGLFVDIHNTLYCSMPYNHQVVKKWLNDNANTSLIAAGTGTLGFASNTLHNPHGIFVDTNFDLYVVDSGNNRIQLFQSGQLNAITVAGTGSLNITIILDGPTGIVLDANKYLFIVDCHNHRIIRSGPTGFRCIVGCSSASGSSSYQLSYPQTLSFDSYGNIFVADTNNNRIQKFILEDNFCSKFFFLSGKISNYNF
jgi:hypothetical protein